MAIAQNPVGDLVSVNGGSSSAQSSAIPHKTKYIRVVSVGGTDAYVAIGTNPTASATTYRLIGDQPEILSIGNPRSQVVVGIESGSTTKITFQEGTGSQFIVGDRVNLTVTGQSDYDFTDKIVTAVDTTYTPNADSGYCRIITVANDSSSGNPASLDSDSFAELRDIVKVAAIKSLDSKDAVVKCQQIQIVGG